MSRWVDGLEDQAREILPEPVHTYFRQGSGVGVSAAAAVQAWRDLRFLPRVLRDVSRVDVASSVAGTPLGSPLAIAPTTLQRQAHPAGEVEMARGAAMAGTLLCVSSNAGSSFQSIAAAAGDWWVQAYVLKDKGLTAAMLERAVAAGARAVVVTVDTPVVAAKDEGATSVWDVVPADHLHANEDLRGVPHASLEKALDLTPDVIGWLTDITGLPVVVKGVLRADDARAATVAGAAAVWVSNHGGRQLDRAVATPWALDAVAQAVGAEVDVVVDGGIRNGLDVLAALALGARAAFVGRPTLWALAVEGATGVARLLQTLQEELVEGMRLAGATDLADLSTAGLVSVGGPRRPASDLD